MSKFLQIANALELSKNLKYDNIYLPSIISETTQLESRLWRKYGYTLPLNLLIPITSEHCKLERPGREESCIGQKEWIQQWKHDITETQFAFID